MKQYKIIKLFPNAHKEYYIGEVISELGGYGGTCNIAKDWPEYFEEIKSHILITEDKVEIYEEETVWCLDTFLMQFHSIVINNTYKDFKLDKNIKLFRHRSKVLKYIEENRPKFSVKQIEEAIDFAKNNFSSCTIIPEDLFKQKLDI